MGRQARDEHENERASKSGSQHVQAVSGNSTSGATILSKEQASMHRSLFLVLLIMRVSCNTTQPTTTTNMNNADFEKLTDDLLYGTLALSPVAATQTGYHEHNGMPLDEMLDDYSAAGIEGQRKFYESIQSRVNALNTASLDREQQADIQIIKNQLNLQLLELNTIQSYKHNPTIYVELAGNALFVPFILEYAPKE